MRFETESQRRGFWDFRFAGGKVDKHGMSTIGTSVTQAVAGADQADRVAQRTPAKRAKVAERRELRRGDVVEIVVPSPDAVDAATGSGSGTDGRPKQRPSPKPEKPAEGADRAALDIQG